MSRQEELTARLQIENAFLGLNEDTFLASDNEIFNLIDGGLAVRSRFFLPSFALLMIVVQGENIPFYPLLNPSRSVDVIIAVDSSVRPSLSFSLSQLTSSPKGG